MEERKIVTLKDCRPLAREDFSYRANRRGYMLSYKGHDIGGVGIARDARGPRGRQVAPQVAAYQKETEDDIRAILEGRGRPDYYRTIKNLQDVEVFLKK